MSKVKVRRKRCPCGCGQLLSGRHRVVTRCEELSNDIERVDRELNAARQAAKAGKKKKVKARHNVEVLRQKLVELQEKLEHSEREYSLSRKLLTELKLAIRASEDRGRALSKRRDDLIAETRIKHEQQIVESTIPFDRATRCREIAKLPRPTAQGARKLRKSRIEKLEAEAAARGELWVPPTPPKKRKPRVSKFRERLTEKEDGHETA